MAGKSSKGRNRKGANHTTNSSVPVVSSDASKGVNGSLESKAEPIHPVEESSDIKAEITEFETATSESQPKQGELHLYRICVKVQSGEKLELQLHPGDSVMDIRQLLLEAPETCYFTCYVLLLHTKDGSTHQLEDYTELSEVADISIGGCSLEMVPALYDDRSIRAHVHRTRGMLSLSTLHASLSTSLALQHELAQKNAAATSGETVKTEFPELDSLGFMEDISGSLGSFLSSSSKEVRCVESIVFSSFNPPPSYRRLTGDLIYLDVITLEGNKFCITGAVNYFYVNSSTGNVLDPRPYKTAYEASTLVGLLQKISLKFKKAFREVLEQRASGHPYENVQSLLPPNSWLGVYPVPDHKRDAVRAEDALTLSFGSEIIGMQRDWNEELQSCREFPHTTPHERIFRDRALYKVTSDFVDAATSGAIGVISGCIPPINPTDPECFQMYVHNNIFFSFAVDRDLEHISKNSASDGSLKVQDTHSLHGDIGLPNGERCNSSGSLEVNGITESSLDGSIETQLTESEQATYGDIGLPNGERCNSSGSLEVNGINKSSPDGSTETQLTESEQATYGDIGLPNGERYNSSGSLEVNGIIESSPDGSETQLTKSEQEATYGDIGLPNGERCNSSGSLEVNGITESALDGSTESQLTESEQATYGDSGLPNGERCNSSGSLEVDGINESSPDGSTDTQLIESEQATYASANNDLKGTKAFQEANVPGLYNLPMAIIDYRGHRVVAQSILPGILYGDKSNSLLYGSVDNGKKINWNEDFHAKVLEAAKRLHLKEHSVLDESGNVFKLAAPVECKGIVGSDDRYYLLDLLRVTPRDANYTGTESRFCILRPELITAFCEAQAADQLKSKVEPEGAGVVDSSQVADGGKLEEVSAVASDAQAADQLKSKVEPEGAGVVDSSQVADGGKLEEVSAVASDDTSKDVKTDDLKESSQPQNDYFFNPNVFTEFKLAGSQEEIQADEDDVRGASMFLTNVVLPKFIQDLCALEVSPMDGQTLTDALHARGINVRYFGKVAEGTRHLPHLLDICSNEIAVRSAKHILKDILTDTEDHELGMALSHFFNCFFGSCEVLATKAASNVQSRTPKKDQAGHHHSSGKNSRGQTRWKGRAHAKNRQSSYMNVSSDSLWSDIRDFAKLKYQFDLLDDARSRVKKVSVVRNLCLKVGITVAARKYDLNSSAPFQTSDILNLQPVVKHSVPVCSEAKVLIETGKLKLAEGMLSEAYALFSEAVSILLQVTGSIHREVANCCRYLATVLYHAGDMAGAIVQQHKELIINERCLGLDHPDTAHSYVNMALFYHGLNQPELALRHMSRALLLSSFSSGPDHPDVAATFINVAMMYQDIGKMNTALRYFQEALKKNERLLGKEHIQTAVCYHALAIAFNCMGAYKLSHQHETKTHDILVKRLGEEDSRTRDSENWMKTFKMREVQMNAQKQKSQTLNAASAIDILKSRPDLIKAFQAASIAGGSRSSGGAMNKSLNAAIIGETLPRGRGVDERAARAAAEVRKKAAARGLSLRQPGVPVQAMQPLSQLLNIINSGTSPDAANSSKTNGVKTEVNTNPSSDTQVDGKQEQLPSAQDQAPVGLGSGLASLNSKKRRPKSKAAAK